MGGKGSRILRMSCKTVFTSSFFYQKPRLKVCQMKLRIWNKFEFLSISEGSIGPNYFNFLCKQLRTLLSGGFQGLIYEVVLITSIVSSFSNLKSDMRFFFSIG
jgi:hypothetical protein